MAILITEARKRQVENFIRTNDGLDITMIKRKIDMTDIVLLKHITVLREEKRVQVKRVGHTYTYHTNYVEPEYPSPERGPVKEKKFGSILAGQLMFNHLYQGLAL